MNKDVVEAQGGIVLDEPDIILLRSADSINCRIHAMYRLITDCKIQKSMILVGEWKDLCDEEIKALKSIYPEGQCPITDGLGVM